VTIENYQFRPELIGINEFYRCGSTPELIVQNVCITATGIRDGLLCIYDNRAFVMASCICIL